MTHQLAPPGWLGPAILWGCAVALMGAGVVLGYAEAVRACGGGRL